MFTFATGLWHGRKPLQQDFSVTAPSPVFELNPPEGV
jgi:hypothetical protein